MSLIQSLLSNESLQAKWIRLVLFNSGGFEMKLKYYLHLFSAILDVIYVFWSCGAVLSRYQADRTRSSCRPEPGPFTTPDRTVHQANSTWPYPAHQLAGFKLNLKCYDYVHLFATVLGVLYVFWFCCSKVDLQQIALFIRPQPGPYHIRW
ncbi:Hypothetical predicted protein [Paramuricea clavata]|uniref:Uncharacterized protein n=1 Tax=Paramuricea clavata TaxID=317549 RepID=A0A7D9ED83_PARCT|nr:Hypothetical predicted protein [Paramuricea clavata]